MGALKFNQTAILGYNELVPNSFLTRICLLAVLVISQAVYAGHAVAHEDGSQQNCQICLHSSAGALSLPSKETSLSFPVVLSWVHSGKPTTDCTVSIFSHSHPSRAPPPLSL